jgi:transcriptional regulator with XRE-family HTH domain
MSKEKLIIAKNIKKLGKQRCLFHDKLSKLADNSHNRIIKIESRAIRSPTMDTAQTIARLLGASLDYLVG